MLPDCTAISNPIVVAVGVVEKVKVEPPFSVLNGVVPSVAKAIKSLEIPVVAPDAPETAIVHTIVRLTRAGCVFRQESFDAEVGLP